MLRVRSDGKLASPKAPAKKEAAAVPTELVASTATPTKTPPKKMLKVRADGKLGSPKARAPLGEPKPKGRKRVSKTGVVAKLTHTAVVRYGTDDQSRSFLGRQIEDILAGLAKRSEDRPSKSSEPSKSTHPFFAGGFGRKSNQKSEPSSDKQANTVGTQNSRAQQIKNIFGPRESRITSKPPRTADTPGLDHGSDFPVFGTDHAKITRFPGARDPIWPPYDMLHVGRLSSDEAGLERTLSRSDIPTGHRKLKDTQIHILPEENIMKRMTDLVHLYREEDEKMRRMISRDYRRFRRPLRIVMTGRELQKAIRLHVACNLPVMMPSGNQEEDELSSPQLLKAPAHQALLHVYNAIPQTRTAFDQSQCETQEWVHKYAPKSAEDVLQQGREAIVLRDWLKGLTVFSVGTRNTRDSSVTARKCGAKPGRKKRRRAEGLDGFIVSSDEEANEMGEVTDPEDIAFPSLHVKKTVIRNGDLKSGERVANAVVISGPNGCGKTAAVFAVAQELGFEIFEVNAGSRRSGKDILDKVGDMTRNHLVKHRQEEEAVPSSVQSEEMQRLDEKLQADLENGRQGTMNSFFQAKPAGKTEQPQSEDKNTVSPPPRKDAKKSILREKLPKPQNQKQSLILLEEVDVLFEEDKTFWATILDLIFKSKRPVIMTCSDESLLPLEDMALYAILRFTSPPASLATDYLLLVAGSEGHLLLRESVDMLYNSKSSDLRASLAELNLYCQMGIGDSKGGLEWMLIDTPSPASQSGNEEPLRVVSKDTYCSGMGWLSGEGPSSHVCDSFDVVAETCANVWNGWGLDLGVTEAFACNGLNSNAKASRENAWLSLRHFEQSCEAFSAADTFPASVVRREFSTVLDTAQPDLTDKMRGNYAEGQNVIQADPLIDQTSTTESLALSLRALAGQWGQSTKESVISPQKAIDLIPSMIREQRTPPAMTSSSISTAFEPIARYSKVALGIPKGPSISSFDSPIFVTAEDVAPYVRSIVSYDLRLEEQRRQLSSLVLQPGREGKKTRTTRASRAALEGGSKANTRRERWFPINTDFNAVLQTGGKGWQDVALLPILGQSVEQSLASDASRRSSLASMDEADM